jgi:acetylornithine deacetylase
MGRVLVALEARDRELRARPAVPFQGTASLHASLISGGRELSSYPDRCLLHMERRTVSGEDAASVAREVEDLIARLRTADTDFRATQTVTAYRSAYRLDPGHPLPTAFTQAVGAAGHSGELAGMSFWTDASVLADAGIPSILFGPGGAGLHSLEEYVRVADVMTCRDVLVAATRALI